MAGIKKVVGAPRFELGTFCTPSKRATRLRYAPTEGVLRPFRRKFYYVYHGCRCSVNGGFPGARVDRPGLPRYLTPDMNGAVAKW